MYAMGVKEYFHHRWNIFDFTIVFVSTSYSILSAFIPKSKYERMLELELVFRVLVSNLDVLDAILVVRILRLVKLVGNIQR